MRQDQMLRGALHWAKKEIKVIPLHTVSKGECTCGNQSCKSPAKHPMVKNWQQWATTDPQIIRQFWQSHPNANVGVVCGDGLQVLDADTKDSGPENLDLMEVINGEIKTLTVRTGSGGLHKYFHDKNFTTSNKTRFEKGLDWKTGGGYVVAPPSLHKSGQRYCILKTTDGFAAPLAEIPDWLKEMLLESDKKKSVEKVSTKVKNSLTRSGEGIPEGGRNTYLTTIAGGLRAQGFGVHEIRDKLHAENQTHCRPPLDSAEVETIASSVSKYPGQPVKKDWKELNRNVHFQGDSFEDIEDEMLPNAIRDIVTQKSKATGLPKAVIVVPVLTTFSALLGSAFLVKPHEKSDYSEYLNLWGLLLAESGSRKTSALSLAEDMISHVEDSFEEIRVAAAKKNTDKKTDIEAEIFLLRDELKKANPTDPKRRELALKVEKKIAEKNSIEQTPKYLFYTSESTPESLADICNANRRGIIYFRDELDGLFKTLVRQNHETLRSMLNEAWNGGRVFRLTRISRGIATVERMTLAILGAIQPEVLIDSFREEMKTGSSGDGLLARFQLCIFYRSSDLVDSKNGGVSAGTKSNFLNLIQKVHNITVDFNLNNTQKIFELVLDREAEKLYKEFVDNHTKKIRQGDFLSSAYRAHYSKIPRTLMALAGQFHVLNCLSRSAEISPMVGVHSIKLALKWVAYLDRQSQRIYSIMNQNHQGVKTLMKKIENGEIKNFDTVRSIYRKNWSGLRDREDVLSAIETLSKYNWIHVSYGVPTGGGRRTELIQIHPDLIKEQTDKTDEVDL